MGRGRVAAVAAVLASAVGVWGTGAAPAGAITATSSGTTVTATVVNADKLVHVGCVGGQVRVGGTAATPSVACTALTGLTILGGEGGQYVDGRGATAARFPALAEITVDLGAGRDTYYTSPLRDVVDLGPDSNRLDVSAVGAADGLLDGGFVSRTAVLFGDGDDSITIDDAPAPDTFRAAAGSWSADLPRGLNGMVFVAGGGHDTIDATGVETAGATVAIRGDAGDDTIHGAQVRTSMSGGTGTNVLVGGAADDVITTSSPTDTIDGGGGADRIADAGGRLGERTIVSATGAGDTWTGYIFGDAVIRSRAAGAPGEARVTVAVARTGSQVLPAGIEQISYLIDPASEAPDRVTAELWALTGQTQVIRSFVGETLVDVVVSTGTATVEEETITFSGPYQPITHQGADIHTRAPFADPEERFAHRVVRDLQFEIPSAEERAALVEDLGTGTTRAEVVTELTTSARYRDLVIDRAYRGILRVDPDPAGRAFWQERLAAGLPVRKLRANLYGSPAYLARANGDLARYVATLYEEVLGRTASAADVAYWVGLIERGTARGTVADRFLNTPENRQRTVRDVYVWLADREPTPPEVSAGSDALRSSTVDGELALIRTLAAGPDYFARPDGP